MNVNNILKQYNDGGFIGSIINTFLASLFILTPYNTYLLLLDQYQRGTGSTFIEFFLIRIVLFLAWIYIFHTFIWKSIQTHSARAACIGTNHPIMVELNEVKASMKRMEDKLCQK